MTLKNTGINHTSASIAAVSTSEASQRVAFSRENFGPIAIISTNPPIIKTGIAYENWIGIAGAFGRRFGNRPAAFLIYPTWSIEDTGAASAIARSAHNHSRRYPDHLLLYLCNTRQETLMLRKHSVPAVFLNKNFTVSERIFRPLGTVEREFDAVHNARFVPEKRHELSSSVHNLAYLGYVEGSEEERQQQTRLFESLSAENPHHRLLNPVQEGRPKRLNQEETNRALNRAHVGLCLSEVEGSNYASMEYMLAGLGVVSTPSRGGRDVYFDKEFCIVCDPNPSAVRDAVAELIARRIPPEYIREKTLARISRERSRFLELIDNVRQSLGASRANDPSWPYGGTSGMVTWDRFAAHLGKLERDDEKAALLARQTALDWIRHAADLRIQLGPKELFPIIRSILEIPDCRLLIFGCGNDSPLWERVNAGGKTVFLENDPAWIEKISPKLFASSVHRVEYGTRVDDWRSNLDSGNELLLDLPSEITLGNWDIVIVDGPAGYDNRLPGRSRSIVTASRLVAPGGRVFVHDCERPLEKAFAARYLGDNRLIVSVRGRGLLNGYAF